MKMTDGNSRLHGPTDRSEQPRFDFSSCDVDENRAPGLRHLVPGPDSDDPLGRAATVATAQKTRVSAEGLAIQIFTLRKIGNLDGMLATAAHAGYRQIEIILDAHQNSQAMKERLSAYGLMTPSAHVSLGYLKRHEAEVLEACAKLGITHLNISAVPIWRRRAGIDYWKKLGASLGSLSARFETAHGLILGYHNHGWEFRANPRGRSALGALMDEALGTPLTWQVDFGWLIRSGEDPHIWLDRYRGRIASVHMKDFDGRGEQVTGGNAVNPFQRLPDWQAVWKHCVGIGARLMVVESDDPGNVAAFCHESFLSANALLKGSSGGEGL